MSFLTFLLALIPPTVLCEAKAWLSLCDSATTTDSCSPSQVSQVRLLILHKVFPVDWAVPIDLWTENEISRPHRWELFQRIKVRLACMFGLNPCISGTERGLGWVAHLWGWARALLETWCCTGRSGALGLNYFIALAQMPLWSSFSQNNLFNHSFWRQGLCVALVVLELCRLGLVCLPRKCWANGMCHHTWLRSF